MSLNRRRFLIALGASSGLGAAFWGRNFGSQAIPQSTRQNGPGPTSPSTASPTASSTAPAASSNLLLRFVALADAGSGQRDQAEVAAAMTQYHDQSPYKNVVFAGDNIYTNGEIDKIGTVFEQPYKALLDRQVKFHACLGNHDIRYQNGDQQVKYPKFNMSDRYYTYRERPVQFFVLDTNTTDWTGQLAWLERELKASDAPWKVVYGHHPIYSSGHYGTNAAMVDRLTPLFKHYHVQLYINGHEHNYERTQPIDGTAYLIVGGGGATLRPVGKSPWTAYSVSRFSFAGVEVYADRLEIQGIGTDGKIFDHGTLALNAA
jgi:Calcineurin-like phosphoesterase